MSSKAASSTRQARSDNFAPYSIRDCDCWGQAGTLDGVPGTRTERAVIGRATLDRIEPTDFESMANRYDRGRELPLPWLEDWRHAVAPYLASTPGLRVVDVGAGTGLFAAALATWFEVQVLAVEPSDAMRRQAVRKRSQPGICWVGGRAEQLPLREGSCDAAWLSTVVHHVGDLAPCARELRRVLRPGAPVLIRNAFAGRTEGVPWLRFFPEAQPLVQARWPKVEQVEAEFRAAGFEPRALTEVSQVCAADLGEYADRVRVRADSTLTALPDQSVPPRDGSPGSGRCSARTGTGPRANPPASAHPRAVT